MSKQLIVNCPTCKTPVEWCEKNEYRPFCCRRCKDTDFCSWAHEEQVLPGNRIYDDLLSDELLGPSNPTRR